MMRATQGRPFRVILYEYPFNERIRTYLRLEHLIRPTGPVAGARCSALDHHYALTTIFEVMDVTSRADLKSDVLKDLEKQKAHRRLPRQPGHFRRLAGRHLAQLDDAFSSSTSSLANPATS
jgi:cell division protein ZapD